MLSLNVSPEMPVAVNPEKVYVSVVNVPEVQLRFALIIRLGRSIFALPAMCASSIRYELVPSYMVFGVQLVTVV